MRDPVGVDGGACPCHRNDGGISADTSIDVEGHNSSCAPILIFAESLTGLEIFIQDQLRGKCTS
jgi:hypothetical protein